MKSVSGYWPRHGMKVSSSTMELSRKQILALTILSFSEMLCRTFSATTAEKYCEKIM